LLGRDRKAAEQGGFARPALLAGDDDDVHACLVTYLRHAARDDVPACGSEEARKVRLNG
jgi:hypothetical protein